RGDAPLPRVYLILLPVYGVFFGLFVFALAFLLTLALRRDWLGWVGMVVLTVPVGVLGSTPPSSLGVACAILSVGLVVTLEALVMARFGLLTAATFFVGGALVAMTPLTWHTSAWYFGQALIGAAVVLALAAYGYVT